MVIIITTIIITPDQKSVPRSKNPVLIIAEIAQAHDGSLGMAHAYIDAVAGKADAVKFQTHIASAESTPAEPWRVQFSKQDKSRYDYWRRMEFTQDQWRELKEHANEKDLIFISSPFSIEAVDLLIGISTDAWKIASGEVSNLPLFEKVASTGQKIFLSTGMSPMAEIDRAVELLSKDSKELTVMQCTSLYPTPPEKVGLNMMDVYRERYGVKAGLSDHTGSVYTGLAAAAMGADAIEVHVTFSREMFGPDVPVSLTMEELKMLYDGANYIRTVQENPVDKDAMAEELTDMRKLFNKSIVARDDIAKGTVISEDMLAFKKPGTGLSPDKAGSLTEKKAVRDIKKDELILLSDIE